MVRKQLYIFARQEALLKRRARELGVSEAELIRQGIEQLGRTAAPAPDRKAWGEALACMRQRQQLAVAQTGRDWKRDELYEERLGRVSR